MSLLLILPPNIKLNEGTFLSVLVNVLCSRFKFGKYVDEWPDPGSRQNAGRVPVAIQFLKGVNAVHTGSEPRIAET